MFFPPRKTPGKGKEIPIMSGLPGLQLNLNINHMQLLGTLAMLGLSRRPGFREDIEEFMGLLRQFQEAADIITVQMENMQKEFQKVQAKVTERQGLQAPWQESQNEAYPHMNPFMLLQQLFQFMS